MRILVTNDDGIDAPGILSLAQAVQSLGEVYMVAPASQKSGVAHGLTLFRSVQVDVLNGHAAWPSWAVHGTPVDCVKLAFGVLLEHRPDLVVSGINLGQNLGINTLYSGTVGAAMEACFQGVPALAVSLGWRRGTRPDFSEAARIAAALAPRLARRTGPPVVWNLNVPPVPAERMKGLVVTRASVGGVQERFEQVAAWDGGLHYRLGGEFHPHGNDLGWDDYAFHQEYATLTPLGLERAAPAGSQDLVDAAREAARELGLSAMPLGEREPPTNHGA